MYSLDLAQYIRENSLRMVHASRASHIASALSIVDILAVLYCDIMHIPATSGLWSDRDRLILSKGHATVALYAALSGIGVIHPDQLSSYGIDGSVLMNHASHKVRGVEMSTGSLGHGLPVGVGKALFAKLNHSRWHTYVILSDGELDEGSNWEAAMFASHQELSSLTAIVDYNKLQSLDSVENTLQLEPLVDKFRAFGWHTIEVDGHSHTDLKEALQLHSTKMPTVIIAHTVKGKAVPFMENNVEWHYRSPDDSELDIALKSLKVGD